MKEQFSEIALLPGGVGLQLTAAADGGWAVAGRTVSGLAVSGGWCPAAGLVR